MTSFTRILPSLIISSLTWCILVPLNSARAQVTPDNTLGGENSIVTPNQVIKDIPSDRIDGGAIRGGNLFHSFTDFNIGEGRGVYFTNPSGIENILTRVTGNNLSNILGTLGVNGGANLFLLNPNGIIFGKDARLDINGSFVGSTANAIGFENQGFFSATDPQTPSQLLTVKPDAFFFNQLQPGKIESSSIAPLGNNFLGLKVPDGRSLLLVGGEIAIDGGVLNANGGRVELAGLAGDGTVGLNFNANDLSLTVPDDMARADVLLNNLAFIDVSGDGSGSIAVNARKLELKEESRLFAGVNSDLGTADAQAGDIIINATDKVLFDNSFASNYVSSGSVGNSGDISITTGSLDMLNGAFLQASTFGKGDAGSVTINATELVKFEGEFPTGAFSQVNKLAEGNAGGISINTGSLEVLNGARLFTSTSGVGDAGNVTINATSSVKFDGEFPVGVFTNAKDEAVGKAGNIFIKAGGNITIGTLDSSSSSSVGNARDGGGITLDAGGDISIKDSRRSRSSITFFVDPNLKSSSSSSAGNAGNGGAINFNAGGDIIITNSAINSSSSSSRSDTGNSGDGGAINLNAGGDILDDDSYFGISLDSSSFLSSGNAGNGGAITLNAGRDINTFGGLIDSSSNSSSGNAGDGATITINAGRDIATNNVKSSSSSNSGNARDGGAITFNAGGNIITNKIDSSSLSSQGNAGNGGAINLFARNGDIAEDGTTAGGGSIVSFAVSEEQNAGNGGNITLETNNGIKNLQILTESSNSTSGTVQFKGSENLEIINTQIVTSRQSVIIEDSGAGAISRTPVEVNEKGQSGDVFITSNGNITFNDSQIESDTKGENPAGNVNITSPGLITFNNSRIISDSNSTGDAGSINISADKGISFTDANSGIFAQTSDAGKAGNITVNTPELTLSDTARITATATETATNQEGGGSITLNASKMNLAGIVGVFAETQGESPAGTLTLKPDSNKPNLDLSLAPGAKISASTSAGGNGGDLIVNAPEAINISGAGKLAVETTGAGDAGNIEIGTQKLTLSDGVQISASTESSGKAGNINLKVGENINLAGRETGIFASTTEGSTGESGNIIIDPKIMTIEDGAEIAVDSQGENIGGNIDLTAGLLTLENGTISAETRNNDGGNIQLNLQDWLLLRNGSQITTTAGNEEFGGNGGNINIDSPFIVAVPQEDSDITANAFRGDGGNVDILTQGIFGIIFQEQPRVGKSDITASSEFGVNGNVNISLLEVDPAKDLVELPVNLVDASNQISNACTPGGSQFQNEFVITGRGGLPMSPTEPLQESNTLESWVRLKPQGISTANTTIKPPSTKVKDKKQIVEATGWIVDEDGNIEFVADTNRVNPRSNGQTPAACKVSG